MNWIVPCNPKHYDIYSALAHSDTIYWRQKVHFEVGDTVYVYLSAGVSTIRYKATVIHTDIDSGIIADPFWDDPKEANKVSKKAELRFIKTFNTGLLSYENLKRNGLKSTIQEPIKLSGETLSYVQMIEERGM